MCEIMASISLESLNAELALILHRASSGSLDSGTTHQMNPTTWNAEYEGRGDLIKALGSCVLGVCPLSL